MAMKCSAVRAAQAIGCTVEQYLLMRQLGKKWCYTCREWREREHYYPNRHRHDGLDTRCRDHYKLRGRR